MLKVLIADDEEKICKLIQILADWRALNMEVVATAGNGMEALRLLALHQPDILITDIRMPGCDGLELISRARELQPQLEMIIISGYAHFEYAKTSIQYGVSDYLLKPINKVELQNALAKCARQCLERQSFQREHAMLQKNSREDWNLLRDNLVTDLLAHNLTQPDAGRLEDSYHFLASDSVVQAFVLQMDTPDVSDEAMAVIRERISEVFREPVGELCQDLLLAFRDYATYGIMSYDIRNRAALRRVLRNCRNQLDAQRNLFGQVQFTLALGSRETAESLPVSFHSARSVVLERMIEGTGRMLEGGQEDSALVKEPLLHQYGQTMSRAVELLSRELAREAVQNLRDGAMAVKSVRGRELMDLVRAAADLFTARFAMENRENLLREFYRTARRAANVDALFHTLAELQDEIMVQRIALRSSDADRPIRTAKQYIQRHFAEQITLEEVAEATGFSVSYFSTIFKKETGEGFNKYLTRIRMEEAKQQLRESDALVVEICRSVGYNDLKHFSQTFHKSTGLTPGEYRKLYG